MYALFHVYLWCSPVIGGCNGSGSGSGQQEMCFVWVRIFWYTAMTVEITALELLRLSHMPAKIIYEKFHITQVWFLSLSLYHRCNVSELIEFRSALLGVGANGHHCLTALYSFITSSLLSRCCLSLRTFRSMCCVRCSFLISSFYCNILSSHVRWLLWSKKNIAKRAEKSMKGKLTHIHACEERTRVQSDAQQRKRKWEWLQHHYFMKC